VVLVAKTQPELGAKGTSLILVEADRAGFRKGRKLEKMGQEAADTAELFFENVRVPVSNLLGEEGKGFGYLMTELAQERFIIAVGAATKLEAMLEETIRYTKERMVFGKPLFDFQNTRFKLAEIKARATAVRMMVDQYLAEHMRRKLTRGRSRHCQALLHRRAGQVPGRDAAVVRGLRLHDGIPDLPRLRGCACQPHLWWHQRGDERADLISAVTCDAPPLLAVGRAAQPCGCRRCRWATLWTVAAQRYPDKAAIIYGGGQRFPTRNCNSK
jgi:hypothetical protein